MSESHSNGKKILMMGSPNVGKSALFSRLTGTHVVASNYSGTTVEFVRGKLKMDGETAELIDVPGSYSLDPTNRAEEVAVDMLKDGDLIMAAVVLVVGGGLNHMLLAFGL